MSCADIRCIECKDHDIKAGKIVCNKENRLGLRKSKVEDFFGGFEKK